MNITTTYKTNASGTGQIVARGLGGKQKTTTFDHSRSVDANHGIAAAALIQHVQRTSPELQYGDNICSNVVRSLDAGYGEHTVGDDGKHRFDL
jgi:hypothetical protein